MVLIPWISHFFLLEKCEFTCCPIFENLKDRITLSTATNDIHLSFWSINEASIIWKIPIHLHFSHLVLIGLTLWNSKCINVPLFCLQHIDHYIGMDWNNIHAPWNDISIP